MEPRFKIPSSAQPEGSPSASGPRAAPVTRYTRFVLFSKHSLWILIAITIGLVVWIASYNTGENGSRLVFSGAQKLPNLANLMLKPHYQGVDAHDRPYTVIAEKATQIDKDHVSMHAVRADMLLASGAWVALNAGTGELDTLNKKMFLKDGVDTFYDGGYEFRSDHAQVDIQLGNAYGDSPVEGQGPAGTLKANSFKVVNHGEIIYFNGSVRMKLYR